MLWGVWLVIGLIPLSAQAWKQLQSEKTQKPLSWQKMPIQYAIDAKGLGDYFQKNPGLGTPQSEFSAIRFAFDAWANVFCPDGGKIGLTIQSLGFVSDQLPGTDPNCDACNTNLVVFITDKDKWTRPSGELAVALPVFRDLSGQIFDADILINAAHFTLSTQAENPDDVKWDIQNAVTHEVGHLLGLAHSDDTKSTMYAKVDEKSLELRTLEQDDVEGICAIYPPQSTNQKVPTYTEEQRNRNLGCNALGASGSLPFFWIMMLLFGLSRCWPRRAH